MEKKLIIALFATLFLIIGSYLLVCQELIGASEKKFDSLESESQDALNCAYEGIKLEDCKKESTYDIEVQKTLLLSS